MHLFEEMLASKCLYDGKIIHLFLDDVRLENGALTKREVIRHPGGVGVLPVDEKGNVLLVKQFRYPHGRVMLEIPAGKLDVGEDPLECGKRELEEECGVKAQQYISLGVMHPTPGYLDETVHLYAANGLYATVAHPDEGEFLDVVKMPFEEAVKMVMDGRIADGKSQIAILKYQMLSK